MTNKNSSVRWIIAAVLLVPICMYVGAYYGTVEPSDGFPGYPRLHGEYGDRSGEEWERSWTFWQKFFTPIHWLDRRIRPSYWKPTSNHFGGGSSASWPQ